jgi:hypothetical protein
MALGTKKERMTDSRDFKPLSEEFSSDKIYCANCRHCKLVRLPVGSASQFGLRVRCEAGKWRKKLGEEKIYKYFTVIRRTLEECDSYEPMGEVEVFLKELRKSLPIKDELYSG